MNIKQMVLVGMIVGIPMGGAALDLEGVAVGAARDLEKATTELSEVRQQVEAERLPMARKISELEQQLIERRAELARAQRFQENQLVELNALKVEAKRQSDEVKFIDSLLTEYARAFRSRLSFAEEGRYAGMLDAVDKAAATVDLSSAERFKERTVLLTTALDRVESAQGGELIEGRALDKRGLVKQGTVALVGPVAVFASTSGEAAGLLQQELNKADPTIAELDKPIEEASRKLATTGEGELVLDPTLGNAFRLSALNESLYEKLEKGGIVMIPLLGLGVAAVVLALIKWFQFARVRVATEADLQRVLQHLEADQRQEALQYARSIPGMAGDLLSAAVARANEKREHLEEIMYEKMLGARIRLERGLPFLALAATAGPLLGLLGTVTGMIATFRLISSFGSGDPKMLAAGISEALICTATGMAIAIPALLFHAFLSRRAKGIIGSLEQTAVGFVNGVPQSDDDRTFA